MTHPFDPKLSFVQAKNYTWVNPAKPRKATLLVLHSMEAPNKPTTAEGVAAWFAGATAPEASAHACIDMDSAVACVDPKDIAWACSASNWPSYNVEFAGYAKQQRSEWLSPDNMKMLQLAAYHLDLAAKFFGIPSKALSEEEVAECLRDSVIRQGKAPGTIVGNPGGITTHVVCNSVWRKWSAYGLPQPKNVDLSHSDPGPNFPMDVLVNLMNPQPEQFPLGEK